MMRQLLTAFGAVFLAELPDKTMLATLLLTARFRRPTAVWAGVTSAFAVHVVVAVLAGSLLARLPERWVAAAVAVVFAVGGIGLLRSSDGDQDPRLGDDDGEGDGSQLAGVSWRRVWVTSAGTVLVAELGDLTQLATAGLAARADSPWPTGIGSLLALASVAALAAGAGEVIGRRMPLGVIRRLGGLLFLGLALIAGFRALSIG